MKDFKRIITTMIVVVITFFIVDCSVGVIFDMIRHQLPKDGERTAKAEYVINKVDADVVIIGSSRAQSHYDTYVFRDSFPNFTIFNCGGDGQKFWYCDIVTNCILNRYSPKLIIWDFLLDDLEFFNENLSLLYPYYDENEYIRTRLLQYDPILKYQLWCNSYKYNGSGSRILTASRLRNNVADDKLGYSGHAPLTTMKMSFGDLDFKNINLDSIRVESLIRTIKRAKDKDVNVVLTLSPVVNKIKGENITIKTLETICKKNNILFLDYTQLEGFVGNPQVGYDSNHLNSDAARVFTQKLISDINKHQTFIKNKMK